MTQTINERIKGSWSHLLFKELFKVGAFDSSDTSPAIGCWFRAFFETPPEIVKVVIVGQDPYSDSNIADGLAFSCGDQKPQPSLRNIFKEIRDSEAAYIPSILKCGQGDLTGWARQGVLLLNASLTTEEGKSGAHRHVWEGFTDAVMTKLNELYGPIVFLLWGNDAKQKGRLITNPRHTVLTAAHPSPLSAHKGFFGCDHFNKANEVLKKAGKHPIDWAAIGEVRGA